MGLDYEEDCKLVNQMYLNTKKQNPGLVMVREFDTNCDETGCWEDTAGYTFRDSFVQQDAACLSAEIEQVTVLDRMEWGVSVPELYQAFQVESETQAKDNFGEMALQKSVPQQLCRMEYKSAEWYVVTEQAQAVVYSGTACDVGGIVVDSTEWAK